MSDNTLPTCGTCGQPRPTNLVAAKVDKPATLHTRSDAASRNELHTAVEGAEPRPMPPAEAVVDPRDNDDPEPFDGMLEADATNLPHGAPWVTVGMTSSVVGSGVKVVPGGWCGVHNKEGWRNREVLDAMTRTPSTKAEVALTAMLAAVDAWEKVEAERREPGRSGYTKENALHDNATEALAEACRKVREWRGGK